VSILRVLASAGVERQNKWVRRGVERLFSALLDANASKSVGIKIFTPQYPDGTACLFIKKKKK